MNRRRFITAALALIPCSLLVKGLHKSEPQVIRVRVSFNGRAAGVAIVENPNTPNARVRVYKHA